jgi:hypothetical protein
LANGWVLAKDYGNLAHGYCLTSYSSQNKGVDCVFVAENSESFRAANREQFYVSASRFKENSRLNPTILRGSTKSTTLLVAVWVPTGVQLMRSGNVSMVKVALEAINTCT